MGFMFHWEFVYIVILLLSRRSNSRSTTGFGKILSFQATEFGASSRTIILGFLFSFVSVDVWTYGYNWVMESLYFPQKAALVAESSKLEYESLKKMFNCQSVWEDTIKIMAYEKIADLLLNLLAVVLILCLFASGSPNTYCCHSLNSEGISWWFLPSS